MRSLYLTNNNNHLSITKRKTLFQNDRICDARITNLPIRTLIMFQYENNAGHGSFYSQLTKFFSFEEIYWEKLCVSYQYIHIFHLYNINKLIRQPGMMGSERVDIGRVDVIPKQF